MLGLCVVAMRWLLNERLGVTGAWSDVVERITGRRPALGTAGWFLIGIAGGALAFALIAGGPDFHGYGWLTATFHGNARVLIGAILVGAGVLIGFGATLSWTGMTSPVVLRQGLLFQRAYLFLFFAAAVLTAFVGLRLLRALRARAVLTGQPVAWSAVRPERRHIYGSVIFGIGWAVADACPGPIATQLAQGVPWSLCTIAGLFIGIRLFLARGDGARSRA